MLKVNQLIGFGAGLRGPVVITHEAAATSTSNLSEYTFSNQSIGAVAAGRFVIVLVAARSSTDQELSSVTVGGVTANLQASTEHIDTTNRTVVGIYTAAIPTGTTADVVVTFDGTMARCGISVLSMTGAASGTAFDTAVNDGTGVSSLSVNINSPSNGGIVGVFGESNVTNVTWTGLTEDVNTTIETGFVYSTAHQNYATAQSGLTVTATTGGADFQALAVASFRP